MARCFSLTVHRLPMQDAVVPTVFIRRTDAFVSGAMARLLDLLPTVQKELKK